MTNPSINAAHVLRQVLESALLKLTAPGCTCDPGGPVCPACAAIEALEQLGRAEAVAGLLAGGKEAKQWDSGTKPAD